MWVYWQWMQMISLIIYHISFCYIKIPGWCMRPQPATAFCIAFWAIKCQINSRCFAEIGKKSTSFDSVYGFRVIATVIKKSVDITRINDRIFGFLKKVYFVNKNTIPATTNPRKAARLSDNARVTATARYIRVALIFL